MKIDYQVLLPYIRDDHRPYLDAAVEAYHGDQRIGYIKFEWISSLHVDEMLPTVWHFADAHTGWCLGLEPDSDMSDPAIIHRVLKGVRSYSHYRWGEPLLENTSVNEMMEELVMLTRRKGLYRKFEDFKTSIDYVYVGYSRVDDGNRWPKESEASYQRKGIGSTLYRLAAMWLAVNLGEALHSSTLIKPCAIGVWEKMVALGYPITTVRRPETNKYTHALDYSQPPILLARAIKTIARLPHREHTDFPTSIFFKSQNP